MGYLVGRLIHHLGLGAGFLVVVILSRRSEEGILSILGILNSQRRPTLPALKSQKIQPKSPRSVQSARWSSIQDHTQGATRR